MSTLTIEPRAGRRPVPRPSVRQAPRPALRVVPSAPTPAVAAVAPLRLTRRGRVVVRAVVGLLGLVLVAAAVLLVSGTAKAGTSSRPLEVGYHVVRPGETLWQIAGEVAPRADRRDTVLRIAELNALPSGEVVAGQRLAVPVQG